MSTIVEKLDKAEAMISEIYALLNNGQVVHAEPAEHGRGKWGSIVGNVVPRVFRRKVTIKPNFKAIPRNHARKFFHVSSSKNILCSRTDGSLHRRYKEGKLHGFSIYKRGSSLQPQGKRTIWSVGEDRLLEKLFFIKNKNVFCSGDKYNPINSNCCCCYFF